MAVSFPGVDKAVGARMMESVLGAAFESPNNCLAARWSLMGSFP